MTSDVNDKVHSGHEEQRRAYHDIAAGLFKKQPGAEQLHLDALWVGARHVALGERQDDGAARLLRMLQRLPGLQQTTHMRSAISTLVYELNTIRTELKLRCSCKQPPKTFSSPNSHHPVPVRLFQQDMQRLEYWLPPNMYRSSALEEANAQDAIEHAACALFASEHSCAPHLRHDAIIGGHHQDDNVSDLGTASAHGRERGVPGRVQERCSALRTCKAS